MAEILVTKPGVLNRYDKAKLSKAGVVTVEAGDPSEVKLIQSSGAEIPADDMLHAAISALSRQGNSYELREQFVKALAASMVATREKAA